MRAAEPTPEEVVAFVSTTPWDGLDDVGHEAAIAELADRVNRLSPEAKLDPRLGEAVREQFLVWTPAQQQAYLDRTLPRGVTEFMEAVNAMNPEDRRGLVRQAMADLDAQLADGWTPDQRPGDREVVERMIDEGMRAYLSDANAQTKLDLQPLVERMQGVLQGGG